MEKEKRYVFFLLLLLFGFDEALIFFFVKM